MLKREAVLACHFSNSAKKKVSWKSRLDKKVPAYFWMTFGSFNLEKSCSKTFRFIQRVQEISFFKPGNFFCRKLKNTKWHFWAIVKTASRLGN